MPNAFTPNIFSLQTLTAAINNLNFAPGLIGSMGLFEEAGISTLDAAIEERDGVLALVDVAARGAPGKPVGGEARRIRSFRVPHLPQRATILADSVQGVRAFGSENAAESIQTRVNERLAILRRNLDYTIESHRLAAIMGSFYDANGTSTSLFTEFSVSQQDQSMALSTSVSSKAREKAELVKEKIESALDGVAYSGIRVICSPGFWKALLEDKDNKESVLNWNAAASLRNDTRDAISLNGLLYERYRGTSAVKVTDDCAYAIPEGVPGLFLTRFAPANYIETVNTIGLPYYAKSIQMDFDKGYEIEAQSNPINLCTRPAAIVKLTIS
jgi:hypothetical protein